MWQLDLRRNYRFTVLFLFTALSFFSGIAKAQQAPASKPTSPTATNPAGSATAPDTTSKPGAASPVAADPVAKSVDENGIPSREDAAYEDWSKPQLTLGMQTDVVPLGEIQQDGFTRETIHVQWRQLDPIDLWVIRPTGVKKPPVIIYLYSYPSDNERYKDDNFCRVLVKNGFAAVGFVSAFTDQRYHDIPTREWFVSMLEASLGASVHDVQLILNYLDSRNAFDMKRVGMWADGSGASIAIMAAAVDNRIKVLDLLDPWGDWPDWLAKSSLIPDKERADYLKPEFLKSVQNLEPVTYFPELSKRQVRLQYITKGVTVTPAIVQKQVESAAPSNVTIVHYQDMKTFRTDVIATGKGFDWIKEQLGPNPPNSETEIETKLGDRDNKNGNKDKISPK
jgi:hypothetical protein